MAGIRYLTLFLSGAADQITVQPGAGSVTITEYAPTISAQLVVQPGSGTISTTGYAPVGLGTLFPISDDSVGNWTNETGATTGLYQSIDEAETPNDADFVQSENTPSSSIFRVNLTAVGDPTASGNHYVEYRYEPDFVGGGTFTLTVRLKEGATTRASWVHSGIASSDPATTQRQTLSGAEADSITDYGNLKLEFEATEVGP